MIFNNYLTEEEIVRKLIKESDMNKGFILSAHYDEETDSLIIRELSYITEDAPSMHAKDLHLAKNRNDDRHIIVGEAEKGGHWGRIKVSGKGNKYDKNITIRFDNGELEIIGNPKKIDMDKKELSKYVDFANRNINLINLAVTEDLGDVHKAFKKDADLYYEGIEYERKSNGDLIIFDYDKKGNRYVKSVENLKGGSVKI